MTSELSSTTRTTHRRLREQGRTDRSDLFAVLASGLVAHLGVVNDGWPMVVPTSYGFDDTTLYLHGSVASVSLRADSAVCVTITLADGLVLARSVFEHALEHASPWKFADSALEPAGRGEIPCSGISCAHASGRAWASVKHNPPSPALWSLAQAQVTLDGGSLAVGDTTCKLSQRRARRETYSAGIAPRSGSALVTLFRGPGH